MRKRLGFIHLDKKLRHRRAEEGVDALQFGFALQGFDEIIGHARQAHRVGIPARLNIELEAAGSAEPADGRRIESERHAVRLTHAEPEQLFDNIVCGVGSFIPIRHTHEHGSCAGLVTATDQVHAVDNELGCHCRILRNALPHRFRSLAGTVERGAIRQHKGGNHVTLILRWYETARYDFQHEDDKPDNTGESNGADDLVAQGQTDHPDVKSGQAGEKAVEGTEGLRFDVRVLEQQRA